MIRITWKALEGLPAACLRFCSSDKGHQCAQEHAGTAGAKRQVTSGEIDGMAFDLVADRITGRAGFIFQPMPE